MKIHQKGFLLIELSKHDCLWDGDLIAIVLNEYGLVGHYWVNSICVTLDELSSAGLIARIDSRLEQSLFATKERVMFKYQLTDFGRTRMHSTGLLT